MKELLSKYFPLDFVEEICNENIPPNKAVQLLQKQVIQLNNNNLYSDILQFCELQCLDLSNLIDILSVDESSSSTSESQLNSINQDNNQESLTESQFHILRLNYSLLQEKFALLLTKHLTFALIREFSFSSDDDLNINWLPKTLMKLDRKLFYNKILQLLHNQLNHLKDCCNLMKNVDDNGIISDQMNNKNHSVDSLTNANESLDEVKNTLGNIVHAFTDEISDVRIQLINTMQIKEGCINKHHETRFEELEETVKLLRGELSEFREQTVTVQSKLMNQNHQLFDELMDAKHEISLLNIQMNTIQQKLAETNTSAEQSQISVDCMKSFLETIPPFKWEPSEAMLLSKQTFSWKGLSPVLPNEFGLYPIINWRTLGGNRNWLDEWRKLLHKDNSSRVDMTPLLLPRELGGWSILFFMTWWDNKVKMFGGLIKNDKVNDKAPANVNVRFAIELHIVGEDEPFVVDKIMSFTKTWTEVWSICSIIKPSWPIPSAIVQIKNTF